MGKVGSNLISHNKLYIQYTSILVNTREFSILVNSILSSGPINLPSFKMALLYSLLVESFCKILCNLFRGGGITVLESLGCCNTYKFFFETC